MGFIPEMTEECGEYSVEIRSESFYLRGEDTFVRKGDAPCPSDCTAEGKHTHGDYGHVKQRHAIWVYPASGDVRQGTIEILTEDIPKIIACLELVAYREGIVTEAADLRDSLYESREARERA